MSSWLQVTRTFGRSGTYYQLGLEVTDAVGIEPQVFLYLQLPMNAQEVTPRGEFQGACSPSDMVEVPIGEPLPDASPPWFRENRVRLLFRSLEEATAGEAALYEQLEVLLSTRQGLEQHLGETTLMFGDGFSEGESETP